MLASCFSVEDVSESVSEKTKSTFKLDKNV